MVIRGPGKAALQRGRNRGLQSDGRTGLIHSVGVDLMEFAGLPPSSR